MMRVQDMITQRPKLLTHMYWKEKAAFQLPEDTNDYWVLFAVENGSFTYEIQEEIGSATFGDMVLCPPHVNFKREVIHPLTFHVILLQWEDETNQPIQVDKTHLSGKITLSDFNRLSSNYAHLKKWYMHDITLAASLRQHVLTDLWMTVIDEAYSASPDAASPWTPQPGTHKDPLIQQATAIIHEQAALACSMKEIAQTLGLTQVQFTRRFKKSTGMLPIDYLTALRLQKVQHLLLDSDWTLQQIAGHCGYENEFYLSRVFTKRMRMTPSSYRKLHRL
ncbi:AraC family transcriptional regulator [Paenibacillus roseipurpureus]|uniref:AraC family transcriptional regulator n=1 Tax=Paenibacillus roseopurpureus TaxID=2918901 RepID=A0AA96LNV1_9BACL|nr:AraC family transcriptional regulator [Paenibacillus sp. MBLB1832]WNR43269.1 AraC family transcriptional regulator [Paenibacillus sp. MBLB1832]